MRAAATARTNGATVRQREIYRAIGEHVIENLDSSKRRQAKGRVIKLVWCPRILES